jgi:hypothetical protein
MAPDGHIKAIRVAIAPHQFTPIPVCIRFTTMPIPLVPNRFIGTTIDFNDLEIILYVAAQVLHRLFVGVETKPKIPLVRGLQLKSAQFELIKLQLKGNFRNPQGEVYV